MQVQMLNTSKSSCNTYIVYQGDKAIIIDPGFDAQPIFDFINQNKLEVGFVLITHCHPDHCYCGAEFSKKNIKIFITESDFKLINLYNGKVSGYPACAVFEPTFYPRDNKLEFGGMEFNIIPSPGHSRGGVCIACNDYLFSGDTLFYNTVGRTDFPTGSQDEMFNTLESLFSLDKDYQVMPGHGKPTTLFFEKETNPFYLMFKQNQG